MQWNAAKPEFDQEKVYKRFTVYVTCRNNEKVNWRWWNTFMFYVNNENIEACRKRAEKFAILVNHPFFTYDYGDAGENLKIMQNGVNAGKSVKTIMAEFALKRLGE